MSIFVIAHKDVNIPPLDNCYKKLMVGAYNNKTIPSDYFVDDEGDNISQLNSSFCELTGLYWIWKNVSDDIVGLVHYRRFFTRNSKYFKREGILKRRDIKKILRQYDFILPEKKSFKEPTIKKQFYKVHDKEVWEMTKCIINDRHPLYLEDFDWLENQSEAYCFNMFISSKEYCDAYSSWLFDILFDLQKKIDISVYDDYNKRMFGFVAERLMNVWIHHQKLRVKELPIYYTEDPVGIKRIRRKIHHMRNS